MAQELIRHAHYIKLGAGGKWAHSSIAEGRLRFGWDGIPLAEIHAGDWASIRRRLGVEHSNKGTVTADTERLRDLVTSTPEDVWVTFHDSHLWWSRPGTSPVGEDNKSKFRDTLDGWHNDDTDGTLLHISRVPGVIAQLQGFRGTACSVHDTEALRRLISAESSPAYQSLQASRELVLRDLQVAIRGLHWKDFEVLVDLVFRQAGWRRRSMLGESMKFVDLELVEPITQDAYQVQVKSRASAKDFRDYEKQFSSEGFRRLYFIVHSPTADLVALEPASEDVQLILPEQLAELVADGGLVGWVLDKIR